eukprot:g7260.t1
MSSSRDTRNTADIYAEAVEANNEVTHGLKNALKIVDDTREVQSSTLEELTKQGDQLRDVQNSLDDVQEDAKYARSVLDDIGCLCWCCGSNKSSKIPKPKHQPKYKPETKTPTLTPPKTQGVVEITRTGGQTSQFSEQMNAQTNDDPAIALIEKGRKEQDSLIDQISAGLDVLKQGAEAMGTELESQDKVIEDTQRQADNAVSEAKETVNHSAFRRHLPRL